uniref:Uncharacterized protein n=1 Tax=Acrobeloides nanus TaxID=290746 RepID=A0A914EMA2_9BILA
MSLIPTAATFSTAIPVIFLEARLHGQANNLVSQLGVSLNADQCNIGLLTKTSSVLLVAGVGSYFAYRFCAKYLGKDFVWTLLDAAKIDMLARADSRLLHPAAEGFYQVRLGEDHIPLCEVLTDYGFESVDGSDVESVTSGFLIHTKDGKPIRIVRKGHLRRALRSPFSKELQQQGLNALPYASTPIKFEDSGLFGSQDDLSSICSRNEVHRTSQGHYPPRGRLRLANNQTDPDFHDGSSLASDCSASLRIVWDGDPCWDDEFDENNVMPDEERPKSPTPSDISELSAFKNLTLMLDAHPGPSDLGITTPDIEGNMEDISKMIRSKCMNSSHFMYQSVIVESSDVAGSDIMSVCSGRSNLSTLREKSRKGASHGLWELTSRITPEKEASPFQHQNIDDVLYENDPDRRSMSTSILTRPKNPMTDSCISKSSISTSFRQSGHQPHNPNQMIDSAIVADLSEDDARSSHGGSTHSKSYLKSSSTAIFNPSGIIRRACMDKIPEKPSPALCRRRLESDARSIAHSEKSLEWFDDEFGMGEEQETPRKTVKNRGK